MSIKPLNSQCSTIDTSKVIDKSEPKPKKELVSRRP